MAHYNESEIDFEQVELFLKDALDKVMYEENPDVLNDLKKVFKKTIPFSKRMYVAAYLVKEMQGRFRGQKRFSKPLSSTKDVKGFFKKSLDSTSSARDTKHEAHQRVQIDPSVSATIFLSIGKNRRVYPRDLVGLLINVAGVEKERIGNIKVLSNYSFVQLFKDDADKVISTLNEYEYRGRKLVASYSNQKEDEIAKVV